MTIALYLQDTYQYECAARVVRVEGLDGGEHAVILDQTVFYPQGGGQPADKGTIAVGDTTFQVRHVKKDPAQLLIHHIGMFGSGDAVFEPGALVHCSVDKEQRVLNSRYHLAGHLLTLSFMEMGLGDQWAVVKGDHAPGNAMVEFKPVGDISADLVEQQMQNMQSTCRALIAKNLKSCCVEVSPREVPSAAQRHLAPHMLAMEKIRINRIEGADGYWKPCGGTLCSSLGEIGEMLISKYSFKKNILRICYKLK